MMNDKRDVPHKTETPPTFRYNDLPTISSIEELASLLGISLIRLKSIANHTRRFYDKYFIQKSNGKLREISAPHEILKNIQNWILVNILEHCQTSSYAKAYKKDISLSSNAKFHCGQRTVVTIDIIDFFPSITQKDVYCIFSQMKYGYDVCMILSKLCCLNNALPQGAPTSPYLSNLRMFGFDFEVGKYIRKHSLRYTRYADDITISGNTNPHLLIHDISTMLYRYGFKINCEKTRIANKNARQEVTGVIVNSHMQISRERRMKIRQHLYYIRKFGLNAHLRHIHVSNREQYLNQLMGMINFSLLINPNDPEMRKYFFVVKNLLNIPQQQPQSLML